MWEFQGTLLSAEELVRRRTKTDFVLPTKGPKSFTPSGSWLESKQLQTLLDATKCMIAEERVERENALAQAEWDENLKVARVTRVVGRQFEKFGHEENMSIFLFPEEALYLLETNHLQLLYGGVSMSIQQAYTVLIGTKTGCSFVEYMVFSHLLKNGFKVLRHSPKRTVTRYERLIGLHQELPRNRKSRRKCSSRKETNNESKDKTSKNGKKIASKDESYIAGIDNIDLQQGSCDLKDNQFDMANNLSVLKGTVNVGSVNCFEGQEDISSNGSEIEILSEKSICRSEESEDFDITDYSSLDSEDSDCQVIREINTEPEIFRVHHENKVIEEINLSSDGSEGEDPSHIESQEVNELLCDNAKLKEGITLQNEPNTSNMSSSSECHGNQYLIQLDGLAQGTDDSNSIVEPDSSCVLVEQESVGREVLTIQAIEENNLSVISDNDNVKETSEYRKKDEVVEGGCISSNVKEEVIDNCPMTRESVIRRNAAIPLKEETKTVICETESNCYQQQQKEIEVIDLDDENSVNSVIEDKETILRSFPNIAGFHIMHCDVPPMHLCPPNVCPIQQTYSIILERLQDPKFGGNPRRKKTSNEERFQNNFAGHQNTTRENSPHRFHSRPNRRFSRYINSPRDMERSDRWRNFQHGDESFGDHSRFREHMIYHNFQYPHMDCSDQSAYAIFPGQPLHASPSYQHPRTNIRTRGNVNRGMCRPNSYRGHYFRNSPVRRFPRRKGWGSRTFLPERRYFAALDFECNETIDERDGDYVPFRIDDVEHPFHEQPRRTPDYNLREKRHQGINEESIDSSCNRSKRPRRTTANYFPPTRQTNQNIFGTINTDTSGNSAVNPVPELPGNRYNNSRNDFTQAESSDNSVYSSSSATTSESSASSSSSSCTEGSSEDSMDETYENETGTPNISVLLKSDDLQDIDCCLKSLDIVHSVKFEKLAAEPDETLLTIKFDLYQPSTHFRRSDPPVPDFRVVVVQPNQYLPSSRQLAFLGESFDDDVPLLFAVASLDSVAFYLQSVVNLPAISSKEKIHG